MVLPPCLLAAANYILSNVENIDQKNILLYGVGKIGRNACKNLVKHIQDKDIYLINRTMEKAKGIAHKYNLTVKEHSNLSEQVNRCDILIVATGSLEPTITKEHIQHNKHKLIIDLSMPKNVSQEVQQMDHVTYLDVDNLSKQVARNIKRRETEMPKSSNYHTKKQGRIL